MSSRVTGTLPQSVSLPLGTSSVLPMLMPTWISSRTNSAALRENGSGPAAEAHAAAADRRSESALRGDRSSMSGGG